MPSGASTSGDADDVIPSAPSSSASVVHCAWHDGFPLSRMRHPTERPPRMSSLRVPFSELVGGMTGNQLVGQSSTAGQLWARSIQNRRCVVVGKSEDFVLLVLVVEERGNMADGEDGVAQEGEVDEILRTDTAGTMMSPWEWGTGPEDFS